MIWSQWIEGFPLWFRMGATAVVIIVVLLQSVSVRKLISKIKLKKGDTSVEFRPDRRKN